MRIIMSHNENLRDIFTSGDWSYFINMDPATDIYDIVLYIAI